MCNISFFAQCEDCIILHCNKNKILTRVDFKSNNLCVTEVQAVSINLVSLKKKRHSLFSNYTHFYTKFFLYKVSHFQRFKGFLVDRQQFHGHMKSVLLLLGKVFCIL